MRQSVKLWMVYGVWFFLVAVSLWWNRSHTNDFYMELTRSVARSDEFVIGHETVLKNHLNKEIMVHLGIFLTGLIMLAATLALIRQRRRERERNHDLIRASEAKYRMLFEGNPVPMWVYDMESLRFLAVNEFAVDQYGYSKNEFLAMTIREIRPPEDIPYLHEVLNKYTGKKRKVGTARHLKKDGSIIIVDITGHEIEYEGKRAMLVLSKDVTDQKLAEKKIEDSLHEKNILLAEVHHRVKNNMQLISSLLELQSMKIHDETARIPFVECENRIRSMALVHEKLYHSENMSSINFTDYLSSLLSHIYLSNAVSSDDIQWKIIGDDFSLGLDKAVPCGLLMAELVLNAIKHAFPDKRRGSLTIFLLKDEKNYTLKVSDDGIGISGSIDAENSTTLGLQIVSSLTKQLHGEMKITGNSGTEFIITFPA